MELIKKYELNYAINLIANYGNFENQIDYDLEKIVYLYSSYYKLHSYINEKSFDEDKKEISNIVNTLIEILNIVVNSKKIVMRSLESNINKLENNINYYLTQYRSSNKIVEDYSFIINSTYGLRSIIESSINGMKLMKHYEIYNMCLIKDRLDELDVELEKLYKYIH